MLHRDCTMVVSFDAQPLLTSNKTGIGYSEDQIIRSLLAQFQNVEYRLQYFAKEPRLEEYNNWGVTQDAFPFHGKLYRLVSSFMAIPVPYFLFFGKQSNITHFFNYVVPPGVSGKTVLTIHDMCYRACPETVRFRTKWLLRLNLKRSSKRADAILTDSEFSKSEIIKYLNVSPEKIKVVYMGVNSEIYHPRKEPGKIESGQKKYNIPGSYFLYLGTLEPRKNITGLIRAYSELVKRNKKCPYLVLAGGKGWLYEDIFKLVSDLGLQEKIMFPGYIDAEDVPYIMEGAVAFVFPSIYEGFGMPPLEAMAQGTPVITSNAASLPEVVGDAGIMVDPYDVSALADSMERIMADEQLRKELSEKGLQRAKLFTWEKAAREIMGIYKDLVDK